MSGKTKRRTCIVDRFLLPGSSGLIMSASKSVHFVHVSNQTRRLSETVKGKTVKLILYTEQHETQHTPVPGRKTILK